MTLDLVKKTKKIIIIKNIAFTETGLCVKLIIDAYIYYTYKKDGGKCNDKFRASKNGK